MSKTIWDESNMVHMQSEYSLAREILKFRGLDASLITKFLCPDYEQGLSSYKDLPDINRAVKRIIDAIKKDQQITIYGDYDIDGLTATALLYDFLRQSKAKVDMYIPDRFEEGYGLNTKALIDLKKRGTDLVISVDCGTTAHRQIERAYRAGLDIVVTDHHEPDGPAPAKCVACVNPKLGSNKNLQNLAGVGVAFLLARALQSELGAPDLGQEKWLLDLVALGTICDVVPLSGDNRILASFGLRVMQKSRRIGLRMLAEQAGVDIAKITEDDLGFRLGPRLNAAGRLAHAKKALELLTTGNPEVAIQRATELGELNIQRQNETKQIYEEANKLAKKFRKHPILVLSSPNWSHGVVGIVASRLAEKWHKPTIVIQELGELSKGSARSYNSFNIIESIQECSDGLDTFGGHSFAAGVSLKTDNIELFRYRLNEYAVANMDVKNNFRTISIAATTDAQSPSIDMYDSLSQLAPFGNSNPRPYILSSVVVKELRLVGSDATHLRLVVEDTNARAHVAIGFGMANNWPWLKEGVEADIVYELTENIWNNNRSHQLVIIDIHEKEHKNSTKYN